ncbi:MAG TPA: tetratricopeptide repeat protein [Candidatus Krumholzibacteria bacterium]|nr:tetratricopeptide repeat protein [Candidatus Krumholzibacteria bacterium]
MGSAIFSALLVAGAAFLPEQRLWGINHLAFVPPGARYAALGLLLLAFLPLIAKPLYRRVVGIFDAIGVPKRDASVWVAITMIALGSTLIFWTFRSSTLLLGDGQLLVRSFEVAEQGYDKVIMRSASAIMKEEKIAPGTTLAYYGAMKTGSKWFKQPPLNSMRALNCILGGLLMFLLGTLITGKHTRGELRLWLLVLALGSCSIELFYGYIENYTTPTLLLALYVVLAFRALHEKGPLWPAVIPLLAACYAHIQSILFLPSFVYLMLWRGGVSQRAELVRRWTPLFSMVATLGVMAAPIVPKMRKFYVPLGFSNDKYAMFSPHHLADIVNELFMLVPILPVVAMLAWLGREAERATGHDASRDARAVKTPSEWFAHPAEWQLSTTILVPCFLYILFFHPAIGMARDWDLFTMTTTALVPFVLLVLNRYLRATQISLDVTSRFAVPALAVLMVSSVAWISVNASPERTMDRFRDILTYDRTHAAYAWENLAMLQHERKNLDGAIQTMRIAYDHSRNPRQGVRLAVYLDEAKHTDEAKQILEKILDRWPDFTKARFRLLVFLEREDNWPRILDLSRDGMKYNPEDAMYRFFYGEALLRSGQTEEGIAIFRQCAQLDLPASIQKHVKDVLTDYDKTKGNK